MPTCTCNANENFDDVYFHVIELLCLVCMRVTPQARAALIALPEVKYIVGAAGASKSGKSESLSELVAHVASFVPASERPASIARFAAGSVAAPVTFGIQLIAMPRYCDQRGERLERADGCFVIYDAEGQDAGDTTLQHVVLGLLSRAVSHLCYVEPTVFSYAGVHSLARLVSANLMVPTPAGGDAPWPPLTIVSNKYSLAPPAPSHEAWIVRMLRDQPCDPATDSDRRVVMRIWERKLNYCTLAMNMVLAQPALAATLPAATAELLQQPWRDDVRRWTRIVVANCGAFTMQTVLGGNASAAAAVPGAVYADFLDELLRAYATNGGGGGGGIPGVMEGCIERACEKAAEAASAKYDELAPTPPHLLSGAHADLDGARGTWDDNAAAVVWKQIETRHETLVALCKALYVDAVTRYAGCGFDAVVAMHKTTLKAELAQKLRPVREHFDRRRTIMHPPTLEHGHEDTPPTNRVHNVELERNFLGILIHTHYHWATYVHRYPTTRERQVRANGDVHYTPWVRGAPTEVMTAAPYLGGHP